MKVKLKVMFYADDTRYRPDPSGFPIEMPDHLFKVLPSTAVVVEPPVNTGPRRAPRTVDEPKGE